VANQQQELSKRFHISKRFQLSKRFFSCMSAFLFLHKRFHLIILCESALVYFFWFWVSALFIFFSKLSCSYYFNFL